MAERKYNSRELSSHLRACAAEIHTVDDEGNPITKGEALARLLWKKALGHKEIIQKEERDGRITEQEVVRKPEPWAIQAVWERMEGRVAQATAPEETAGIQAEEKVSRLAKNRLNKLAEK